MTGNPPPGHLRWRFGPWRCNCFIVPNTCPWPFLQCLGKNMGWAYLRSRNFWAPGLIFFCWPTAREFVEVPKCGTTSTINWVLQMEGLEGSHFRHFFALNLESAWASSCQPTHQDGPDLYRLQSTTNPSFSKIYTHSDPEGESQLRSLYRSGKAFLQEQGSLVILKISSGKTWAFFDLFWIDFDKKCVNTSQASRVLLGCQKICEP